MYIITERSGLKKNVLRRLSFVKAYIITGDWSYIPYTVYSDVAVQLL